MTVCRVPVGSVPHQTMVTISGRLSTKAQEFLRRAPNHTFHDKGVLRRFIERNGRDLPITIGS